MSKLDETKILSFDKGPSEFVGTVHNLHHVKSKHGKDMCFLMLETNNANIETIVFPTDFKKCSFDLENGKRIKITANLDEDSTSGEKILLPSNIEEII